MPPYVTLGVWYDPHRVHGSPDVVRYVSRDAWRATYLRLKAANPAAFITVAR